MLQIINKVSGCIVRTDVKNWRNALKNITCYDLENVDCRKIKSSNVINSLRNGYEDKYIKAEIIEGNWRD